MSNGPFAEKKFVDIKGRRMAYIDEGHGAPIVFQHGNPTSSYLWRKVMPACVGLGRLIACDMIGMGDSEKLPNSGPDRYSYAEQREYLFALWEELGLDRDVVLVVHDWGATLGFDWARRHADRLQGIAYMEAAPMPLALSEFPEPARDTFQAFRAPTGEDMALRDNMFLESVLIDAETENLSEADKVEYRRPYLTPGENRRPMLTWLRQIPVDGSPPEIVTMMSDLGGWLKQSSVPKLWVRGDPGFIGSGHAADFWGSLPNQTEMYVKGGHFLQESSGPDVGAAVAAFVRHVRS